MSDTNEKVVEIDHLVKYFGSFCAVEEVSFDVYKGDVFGFLGPNGAGKSTTIRTMLSLIRATSGSIRLFGKDLQTHRNSVLRQVGCIVEKPDFYKYLSAERNLEVFAGISGASVTRSRIHEMIDFVGLKGREKDKLSGFSHGMKQRLGIAQALIHDPELIILDEPTTGLDPQGIIDIRNLILQLKNERHKTVVLSSHILSEIELIANRMVIIHQGKTMVQGEVKELLNSRELLVSIGVNDLHRAKQLLTDKGYGEQIAGVEGGSIQLQISHDKIPSINRMLCENGIEVYSIEGKRKLEDYFLKLTH